MSVSPHGELHSRVHLFAQEARWLAGGGRRETGAGQGNASQGPTAQLLALSIQRGTVPSPEGTPSSARPSCARMLSGIPQSTCLLSHHAAPPSLQKQAANTASSLGGRVGLGARRPPFQSRLRNDQTGASYVIPLCLGSLAPHWGASPQPEHVPCPGMEPAGS